jgi:hypothetical protein
MDAVVNAGASRTALHILRKVKLKSEKITNFNKKVYKSEHACKVQKTNVIFL